MKIAKHTALVLLLLPVVLAAQTVTLVNPDAGENYPRSGSTRIIWQYSGLQGPVRLILLRNNAIQGIIADGLPLSPTKFPWTVGQYQGGTAPEGGGYHVRIRVDDPAHGTVVANGPVFAIGPAQIGTMAITSPTAATNWSLGQSHSITWSKSAGTHSVKVSIRLFRGDVFYRWVTQSTDNDGVFEWFIPADLGKYQNNRLEIQSVYTTARSPFFAIGMLRRIFPLHKEIKK